MNLAALETVLKQWWKPLLPLGPGDTQAALYAADGKQAMVSPTLQAQAFYSFTSVREVGVKETNYAVSGVTGKLIPSVTGIRILTLTIRVDRYDQRAGYTAHSLAERARTRLALPKTLENLRLSGYALVDTGPVINLPHKMDDRVFSRAAFELKLSARMTETDNEAVNEIGQIDTVEIESDLDVEETPVLEQINLVITRP